MCVIPSFCTMVLFFSSLATVRSVESFENNEKYRVFQNIQKKPSRERNKRYARRGKMNIFLHTQLPFFFLCEYLTPMSAAYFCFDSFETLSLETLENVVVQFKGKKNENFPIILDS